MAEHLIVTTEDQEKAGIALLGSTEMVTKELQIICDSSMGPWVLKYNVDLIAIDASVAISMKEKYSKLEKADQLAVDTLLAKSAVAVDIKPVEDTKP
jgi:hypothetical protein